MCEETDEFPAIDDCEIESLSDAIVEDTIHCTSCGASMLLGSDFSAVLDPPAPLHCGDQIKLCVECGVRMAAELRESFRIHDVCEHGIVTSEWCQKCHEDYRDAARNAGNK